MATGQPTGIAVAVGQARDALAFSPGGKTFVTVGANGTTALWSVTTGHRVGALMNVGAAVSAGRAAAAVAFSPDGRTLATAGADGTARLWDVATQQEIGSPMTAGPDPQYAVAFSPDGRTLATAGGDGAVRSWDVAFPAGLLAGACAIADQSLTRQQWASYAGTQPFQQVCPAS